MAVASPKPELPLERCHFVTIDKTTRSMLAYVQFFM
jgi:hypothetical protein